jgi:glutathione S-transferase
MKAKLYSLSLSHPGKAAQLMLERKGIETEVVDLTPGLHPALLWARGYWKGTVPAVSIEGRRVQSSIELSRVLDELVPEPALYPADPALRAKVEEAEEWGEREFQSVPRRIFRWGAVHDRALRRWVATEVADLPAPKMLAELNLPIAWLLARVEDGTDEGVRRTLEQLPADLARIDALIAAGVIGGPEPNAADFQILTSVRVLLTYDDLREFTQRHRCAALALAMWPDALGPIEPFLPEAWLQPVR